MADSKTAPKARTSKAAPKEEPRTLDLDQCDVCSRLAVNGRCPHCGFEVKG